jgi:hypothetical protein
MSTATDLVGGDLGELIGTLLRRRGVARAAMKVLSLCTLQPTPQDERSGASRRNVAHHYDIGNDPPRLRRGMNHSCAFFERPDQSLHDAAQQAAYLGPPAQHRSRHVRARHRQRLAS